MASPKYVKGQQRSRPLEVLALGLPRTGTASMALALERLGYRHCAHGLDLMDDKDYTARWEQAADAKYLGKGQPFTRADWEELLGHCAATMDMPCAAFWHELCSAYPDATIVLVQRDEDKWYKSFSESIIDSMFSPSGSLTLNYVEPLLGSRLGPTSLKMLQGKFGAQDAQGLKENARAVYRKHYADIRAAIPADRRLDYELGSGWRPLCEFLGKEIPVEEFPWVNEKDALAAKVEDFKARSMVQARNFLLQTVVPGLVGVAAVVYLVLS